MSECERKRNDRGKLEFQRNLSNSRYSRFKNYPLYQVLYKVLKKILLPNNQECTFAKNVPKVAKKNPDKNLVFRI